MARFNKKDQSRLKIWEAIDMLLMESHLCKDGNSLVEIKNKYYDEILRWASLTKSNLSRKAK